MRTRIMGNMHVRTLHAGTRAFAFDTFARNAPRSNAKMRAIDRACAFLLNLRTAHANNELILSI
jgi:hypothetical protein